jgi:heme A synthase
MRASSRALPILAAVTAATTYLLLVLGSTVRVTDSGMGCPDWPLCNGRIGPSAGDHALWEQSHRYLVALVTVLVVMTALAAWRRRAQRPDVALLIGAAGAALVLQAALGAVTVWTSNAPVTVVLHLAVGMALLGLLVAAAVRAGRPRYPSLSTQRDYVAWTALVATYFVVVSGSILANADADGACPSWPLCGANAAAPHLVALHLVHRGVVALATVVLATLGIRCLRRGVSRAEHRIGVTLLVLLAAQITLGAVVATAGDAPAAEDSHLAVAAAIWCVVVTVTARGRGSALSHGAAEQVARQRGSGRESLPGTIPRQRRSSPAHSSRGARRR